MSLRSKLILIFAVLTATAVSAMTAYSSFYQRQTYIVNEIMTQKQVLSLIRNNVSVQLYAFTNEQLQGVLSVRNLLREKGQTLSHRIQEMQYSLEESYGVNFDRFPDSNAPRSSWTEKQLEAERMFTRFLAFEKESYNQVGSDIVVTYDLDVILPPVNKYIADGVSVSNRSLLPTMLTKTNQYSAGFYLSIFNREFSTVADLADNIAESSAWLQRHRSGGDIAPPEDRAFLTDGVYNSHRPVQTESSLIRSLMPSTNKDKGAGQDKSQIDAKGGSDSNSPKSEDQVTACQRASATGGSPAVGSPAVGSPAVGSNESSSSAAGSPAAARSASSSAADSDAAGSAAASAAAGGSLAVGESIAAGALSEEEVGRRILELAQARLAENARLKETGGMSEPVSAMNVGSRLNHATSSGTSTVAQINSESSEPDISLVGGDSAAASHSSILTSRYHGKSIQVPSSLPVLERNLNRGNESRNYLAYLFKTEADSPFTYAVVQSVDAMLDLYQDVEGKVLNRMQEHMDGLSNYLHGQAIIINSQGKVLSSSSAEPLFHQAPADLMEYCDKQRRRQLEYKATYGADYDEHFERNSSFMLDLHGKTYLVNTLYFRPLSWYIINVVALDTIVDPALSNAMALVLIGLIILVISLLLSVLLSNSLARRIIVLARQARAMSSTSVSDYNAIQEVTGSIHIDGKDEIADLGRAFQRMGQSLSRNINLLMSANSQKNRMEGELNAAKGIQMGMLPSNFELPQSERLYNAALLYPAKEVGGDLYDIYRLDEEHIIYAIGDVSDKGVPAALFMSTTVTLARTCMCLGMSPDDAMTVLNGRLSERNPNLMFVTMFICVLNERTGEVVACNAGHCSPVIIRRELAIPPGDSTAAPGADDVPAAAAAAAAANGAPAALASTSPKCPLLRVVKVEELTEINGPAVGPMPDMEYSQYSFTLGKYDLMFLYTDGVSEAQDSQGGFFGVDRILDIARITGHVSPEGLIEAMDDAVTAYRGDYYQSDDITMVACSRFGQYASRMGGPISTGMAAPPDLPEHIKKHVASTITHEDLAMDDAFAELKANHDLPPPGLALNTSADARAMAAANAAAGAARASRTEPPAVGRSEPH